jgi:hypothetical protein
MSGPALSQEKSPAGGCVESVSTFHSQGFFLEPAVFQMQPIQVESRFGNVEIPLGRD